MSDPKAVEAVDPAKKTSRRTEPIEDGATVVTTEIEIACYWNDDEYTAGDRVSSDGKTYECATGQWVEV